MYHCERKPVSAPINFSPLIYAPATPSISQPESFSLAQISRHPLPARTNGRTKRVHANATRASRCSYCFLCDLHLHLHLHPHLPSFQPTHSTLSLSLSFFLRARHCLYVLLQIFSLRQTFVHLKSASPYFLDASRVYAFLLREQPTGQPGSFAKTFSQLLCFSPRPLSRTVSRIFAGSRRRGVSCNNRQLTRGRLTG